MSISEDFFLAGAPGSSEVYVIPNHSKVEYIEWCQCELFDDKWKQHASYFKQYEFIWKQEIPRMPETAVVIAYIVSCSALLGEKKIAFGSAKELAGYIGREAEDVIFGEYEKILAKDVQFSVEVAMLKLEDYEKLPHYA